MSRSRHSRLHKALALGACLDLWHLVCLTVPLDEVEKILSIPGTERTIEWGKTLSSRFAVRRGFVYGHPPLVGVRHVPLSQVEIREDKSSSKTMQRGVRTRSRPHTPESQTCSDTSIIHGQCLNTLKILRAAGETPVVTLDPSCATPIKSSADSPKP
jgi:hypothetical protein